MLTWLAWLSLGLGLTVVIASIVFVALRGLELWRQLKSTGGAFSDGLGRVSASADALATRTESMAGATEKLDGALSRLAVSRARLQVLLSAWGEVGNPLGRVRDYVPREKKA